MADCLGWVLPVHKAQSSARSASLSRKALTSSSSSVICSILRRRQFWAAIWKNESKNIVFVEVKQERNSTSFSAKSRFCKVSGKEYVWTCRPCFCLFSEYRDIGWSAVPSVAWQLLTLPHRKVRKWILCKCTRCWASRRTPPWSWRWCWRRRREVEDWRRLSRLGSTCAALACPGDTHDEDPRYVRQCLKS